MTKRRWVSCCLLNIHSTVTNELNVERLMDICIGRAAVRINTLVNYAISTLHDPWLVSCQRVLKILKKLLSNRIIASRL